MAWTGIGRDNQLPEIPGDQRTRSADGSRVVGWYVSRSRDDRYDDETNYEIKIFDVATGEEESLLGRSHRIQRDTGEEDGKPIRSVGFSGESNDTVVITYSDGTQETVRMEAREAILRRGAESNLPEHARWKQFCEMELK